MILLKFLLQVAFWIILGYIINHFFGYIYVLVLVLFILAFNIITFDEQVKEVKRGR